MPDCLSKPMKQQSQLLSILLRYGALVVLLVGIILLPSLAAAQVKGPGPYASPVRDQCISEMAKDAEILVACKIQHTADYHEQDVRQVTQNNKHVVAAYAVIWGVLALLMAAMWLRQRKLTGEIARLEAELAKAIEQ